MSNYFDELYKIDVNDHVEKKSGLSYLSWAWAWAEIKKHYPLSYYTVYEDERGLPYFTDGHTCNVKTGVTVVIPNHKEGDEVVPELKIEHIEYLPIMDYRNKSITAENVTSFDVNKAVQRSLTKAVARHGLGLYIYAGEDLPEDSKKEAPADDFRKAKKPTNREKLIQYCHEKGLVMKDVSERFELHKGTADARFGLALNALKAEEKGDE